MLRASPKNLEDTKDDANVDASEILRYALDDRMFERGIRMRYLDDKTIVLQTIIFYLSLHIQLKEKQNAT